MLYVILQKEIEEREINGKEKGTVIDKILSYGNLSDEEIENYVNKPLEKHKCVNVVHIVLFRNHADKLHA